MTRRLSMGVAILIVWIALWSGLAPRLDGQVPGEVRGRVVDARTARPIEAARVEVAGGADVARTDANGTYRLRGLEPRDYTVRVRAVGYAPLEFAISVTNGRTTMLDAALQPSATLLDLIRVTAARESLPAGATTFDRAAIEASHRRDVGELLREVPGVTVTQAGGPGAESHVSIRGSSANEVLVLIDGVPANAALTGDYDFSRLALENVERVTVLPGAQSARYGGRALAGVIAIDTRRAQRDASLDARAGAWGEHGASTTLGQTIETGGATIGGAVSADYRALDGDFPYAVPAVRGGGTARRLNADVTSREVLGTTTLDGGAWSVRARGAFDDIDRGLAGSVVQPSRTGRETERRTSGGLEARGGRGGLSWSATGDATDERVALVDTAPPFGSPYDDTVRAVALTASGSTTLDVRDIALAIGGEARSMDVRATTLAAGSPHWQQTLGAWASVRASRTVAPLDARVDMELGARVDHSSLAVGTQVSPRAALDLSRGIVTVSASIAGGFAPPTLADEFFHEGVLVRANPNLAPERTRNDLQARVALRETAIGPLTLAAQGAVFRADVNGMILWTPDFRFIWSPSNFDVHRSGWELSGRASLAPARIDVQGSLNEADVVYTGGVLAGQVAYRPRTTGNVTVTFSPSAVRLELANDYVGARRTVPGSSLNALDPYWRTDARLTANVGERIETTFGVENLFDRQATMLVDYPFPARTWTLAVRVHRRSSSAPP